MHRLSDVGGVNRVMIWVGAVIALLNQGEQLPSAGSVQLVVRDEPVHVEQVDAENRQAATCVKQ